MLANTFLAITAHKAKNGHQTPDDPTANPDPPTKPKPEPTPPIHQRLITLTLAEIRRLLNLLNGSDEPPSTTAYAGQPGAAATKPTPAEPISDDGFASRH